MQREMSRLLDPLQDKSLVWIEQALAVPPILSGFTEPVARWRCDHFTTDDTA